MTSSAEHIEFNAYWHERPVYTPPRVHGWPNATPLCYPITIRCVGEKRVDIANGYTLELIEVWGIPRELSKPELTHLGQWILEEIPNATTWRTGWQAKVWDILMLHDVKKE